MSRKPGLLRLDPSRCWVLLDARRRRERDGRRRRNLDNLRELWRAVASGEIEQVMQLTAPDVRVVAHGNDSRSMNANGPDEVRRYFERIYESGVARLEYQVDQLVADARGICTAGLVRIPYPGSMLRALGYDVDDPDASYVYETRTLLIWSLDDESRLREQASYAAGDGFADIAERKLARDAYVRHGR